MRQAKITEEKSRKIRSILGLSMLECKSIANRLHCHSLSQIIDLFDTFKLQRRQSDMFNAFESCLLSRHKTSCFLNIVKMMSKVEEPLFEK